MFYFLTREKSREIWINTDYTELFPPLQAHNVIRSSECFQASAVFKLFRLVFCFPFLSWHFFFSVDSEEGCSGYFIPFSFSHCCLPHPDQGKDWFKLVLKWPCLFFFQASSVSFCCFSGCISLLQKLPTRTGHTLRICSQLRLKAVDKTSRELVAASDTGEVVSLFWERFPFLWCLPGAELGVLASVCDRGKSHSGGRAGISKRFLLPIPAYQMEWVTLLGPCICSKAYSCFLDWWTPKTCAVEVQIAVLRTQVSWQQLAFISIFYKRSISRFFPVPEVCIAEQHW